ncbi:DNA polymerase III subunit alpha [bacterium]|nr:DNA polymerase III subunit alpha [bacterium]
MGFVHLHLHTTYSFLDGMIKPKELMVRLKELDMNAAAITDHGNMHGVVDFYTTARDAGIKPILGIEAYISADSRKERVQGDAYHIVLLAESEIGYKNISYLSSHAFVDGFYYKPRIDRELLEGRSEGIIALSACMGGEISRALIPERITKEISESEANSLVKNANKTKAIKIGREYQEIFGKDNFFIEIQVNGIQKQEMINPLLIEVAREIGAPLVATNDAHYLKKESAEAQETLFAITAKTTLADTENRLHHETDAFYLKSEQEMRSQFESLGDAGREAIDNTVVIADRCSVELDIGHNYLPPFDTEGLSEEIYLKQISNKGLEERFIELNIATDAAKKPYYERLEFELGIITEMGFPGYFLIVADFIQWSKDNNIPVGPGRGSGAGSLVAYSTKITDLDPLRYGLFFERFLNPDRVSMPDFDIDFCQDNRERVIDYVTEKYGENNVAQIATYAKMKAKSAVRDVARALDMDLTIANNMAKLLPDSFDELLHPETTKSVKDITKFVVEKYKISEAVSKDPDQLLAFLSHQHFDKEEKEKISPLITALAAFEGERRIVQNDEDYSKILNIATQVEGLFRQTGKHAAGLVIGAKEIWEYSPFFIDKDKNRITQYDKDAVELVGLVKFDFLGLKTLTMIAHAERLVRQRVPDFDINKIPVDDVAVFEFLGVQSTLGIFQMESDGFAKMVHGMKPDRFEDLIAAVALYRPGPMDIIPNYIARKHGREDIVYDHEWLEPILKETFGLIVYQEQVMQISQVMAGFSLGKADILRRAMGKKKLDVMETMKVDFLVGAKEKGVKEEIAVKVFNHMFKFASYGFNKSHAACYGYISYQTAYLKTHYAKEFFAAMITSVAQDSTKVLSYINDATQMGIVVAPPDVNTSGVDFTINPTGIRFGLGAIKNVGEASIVEIVDDVAKNGSFNGFIDFLSRIDTAKVNLRTLEYLIKAGAFDFSHINRGLMIELLPLASKEGAKIREDRLSGQTSLFSIFSSGSGDTKDEAISDGDFFDKVQAEEWDLFQTLAVEREVLGVYLSSHPARYFEQDIKNMRLPSVSSLTQQVAHSKYGMRESVWVFGVVTTEIKPQKGRDGDFFLRGVIEGPGDILPFSMNKLMSAKADEPPLAILTNLIPLFFRVKIRANRDRDTGEFSGISAAILKPRNDIKTFKQFVEEEGHAISLNLEISQTEVDKAVDLLQPHFAQYGGVSLKLHIAFPKENGKAVLSKKVVFSDELLRLLKTAYGKRCVII